MINDEGDEGFQVAHKNENFKYMLVVVFDK